jgi:hypothetical protein
MTNAKTNRDPGQSMVSMMSPISAGKDRIRSMVASVGPAPSASSAQDSNPPGSEEPNRADDG